MSYRKQISYLELQENGQRIGSAGHARLESLEKEKILAVQLNGQGVEAGRTVSLYLQRESGEQLLCEMTADRGGAACEKRISEKEDRESILGIRIPLEQNLEIIGKFARAGGMKKAPVPAPEPNRQTREQTTKAAETIVTNGKTNSGSGAQNLSEFRNSRDSEKPDGLARLQEDRTAKGIATENTLQMKDTKWEQLSSIYPHIHPFRDAREFLSVGPEDFVILRERYYQMTHNSFLLHGYYNYRHLLLVRQETAGEAQYYIGVPGNFYEREKQVARMFGFESFEGVREPAWDGDFGYYLIPVEL